MSARSLEPPPPCPLCGSGQSRPSFGAAGFRFRDCVGCRTLFVDRLPGEEELARFYQDPARDRGSNLCWEVETRHDVSSLDRALGAAERSTGRGPVLDVGCGAGHFLARARDRGWHDLTGLELSPEAAALARTRSGARVIEGTLDAPLPDGHYAIVTMWDVLEHLRAPRQALKRVAGLVRPGGIVAISTPNRFGVAIQVRGSRSVVICPPEHLLLASRRGLVIALRAAGLEPTGVWSEDLRIREWLGGGNRGRAGSDHQDYHDVQGKLTTSRWFGVVRTCANFALRASRLGDQLLTVAVKRAR